MSSPRNEWNIEISYFDTEDNAGAFGSVLALPVNGRRLFSGSWFEVDEKVWCWTVTSSTSANYYRTMHTSTTVATTDYQLSAADGAAVRCIID